MAKRYLYKLKLEYVILVIVLFLLPLQKVYGFFCNTQSQKITYSAQNIPLRSFFQIIHNQTGIQIINNESETNLYEAKKISVNFVQAGIEQVMNFILIDKHDLHYSLSDNIIIISKSYPNQTNRSLKVNNNDTSINQRISGKVIDNSGNAIPGATIKVKNGKYGTITNSEGIFQLNHIKKGDIISISSIGFESTSIKVLGHDNITANLKPYINNLDEKIVIAYGNTTRRFNTGNIGSIKSEDIENQPINNPILALEGRVAGVFIEQASGVPGTGVKIAIQGKNSIMNGNDPLFVIDGVPYISQLIQPPLPGITAGSSVITGNPLNFINPSDIERIEILKDADATAIYGSRAANGAVLITTKRGKSGEMKVNLNMQKGWGKVGHKLKVLNASEYLSMRREALKNDQITQPSIIDYDLNGTWDTTQTKDWQRDLIGGSAQYTDIQLGFSGGTDQTQYLISGAYHKETSVFPGDFSDTKGSTHFNTRSESTNHKFRIQLSGSYMKDNNLLPNVDLTGAALQLAPIAPNPLNSDGTINWSPTSSGASTFFFNPLSSIKKRYSNKTDNLTSQSLISYDIYPWLTIKSSFGYNSLKSKELAIEPLSSMTPEAQQYNQPTSTFSSTNMTSWIIEPGLDINKSFSNSKLTAYIGGTLQSNHGDRQSLIASGFSNDLVIEDIKSAPILQAIQSVDYNYKYSALYGRVNYNIQEKYILNLTARRDGSSRFGPKNQFHNFGAIGAAWIFSQATVIQKYFPFLSFGKIRASYGTTGNDQIGDYQFLDLYDIIPAEMPYQQNSLGLGPTRLSTPDLQWEETKKLQIGLEIGLFSDRLLISSNYNLNKSSNQLIGFATPYITGFPGINKNFNAVVQNTGWELTLNSVNIRRKGFSWTTNINLTIPKNKLASYASSTNSSYIVGQSISARPVAKLAGVNDTTGVFVFFDDKGNLTSLPKDITKYITTDPNFYGGLQNNITYKGFSINFLFQFVKRKGQDLTYGYSTGPAGSFLFGYNNQPVTVLDRWQNKGDKNSQPKFTTDGSAILTLLNARGSDATYVDASYIRFKNISLSWQIPNDWLRKIKIKNLRIYALGQNLLTITNYFGMDPESRGIGLPPLKVITFGTQVTL